MFYTHQKGFTLIEMVIYVAIVGAVFTMVVTGLILTLNAFAEVRAYRELNHSATIVMERLVREVHDAESLDTTVSVFGSSPGRLSMYTPTAGGGTDFVEFIVTNGVLHLYINDVDQGPLHSDNTTLDDLTFYQVTSSNSSAVRFEVSLTAEKLGQTQSETFYGFAVLRGSY